MNVKLPTKERFIVQCCGHVIISFAILADAVAFCNRWKPSYTYLEVYDIKYMTIVYYWIY